MSHLEQEGVNATCYTQSAEKEEVSSICLGIDSPGECFKLYKIKSGG